ncbi:MAG: hypothetical protein FWD44_06480 [Oscillospiraceae bacterium]|nr:hypothetical protein [Oscillospiraceae bacterium]
MKKKAIVNLILLHALFLVVVYVFQGVIFPYVRFGGFVPLLLPVAVTGIALYEGRYKGGLSGLFAGIFCDISFNQPVGTFTVFLTLVGLGIGTLSDTVVLSGFIAFYIGSAAVLIVSAFIQMLPIIALPHSIPTSIIMGTVIGQTVYSLVLAFPIWFIVRALGKRAERITPSGRIV